MDNMTIRFARLAIALSLLLGGTTFATAQKYENTPVSISKEKVRINGKVCYSHIVLERQTLFSISKAYNVSVDDIYKFNPTLKETGLIKNSIIIIPSADAVNAVSQETAAETETAEAAATPQPETVIPAEQEKNIPEAEVPQQKTHTVKWYENLNDIAARYGVSVNEIMAANGLKGKKLKSRMKLIIPAPGEYAAAENLSEETVEVKDSTAIVNKAEEENVAELPWWHNFRKDKVTATLLLPMKANGISSSWSNMDFYSGVLLAVNDISQNGTDVDLRVHDITDGKIEACRNDIRISDFVIGPVSSRDLGNTLMAEPSHMIISPLDPKAEELVATNPNMIQAPTPHKVQYDDLVSWMKEDMAVNDRVIVISEKGGRQTEAVTEMKRSIDSSGLAYRTFSYSILEGRDVLVPLKELMADDGSNRVLIASESEAFVNDVVRNLNLMIHQKYNVVLYAASKIRSFDTIEVENFHKTNLHVSLTYYIDYDDPRVKNFLLKYRALFNTEPSQFAFQGYDIASYFMEMNAKYGNRWPEMLEKEEKAMLQSSFRCVKSADGGYTNHGVRRIVYGNDWKVIKVK